MTAPADWQSGKGHRDWNFPVASVLIAKRHRPAILAFYRFARAADDAADHPDLPAEEKLRLLDRLEATLRGEDEMEVAVPLREIHEASGMSPAHAFDLLRAFRRDVSEPRVESFDALMDYCRVSAMPVGRFVLDVHGEPRSTWGSSDALCAALQIINHLQDCGEDYRRIGRVYIPEKSFAHHGAAIEDLSGERATPALRRTVVDLADRVSELLETSRPLAQTVQDRRLKLEIALIQRIAERINERLKHRDPLSERVHLTKFEMATAFLAVANPLARRSSRPALAATVRQSR